MKRYIVILFVGVVVNSCKKNEANMHPLFENVAKVEILSYPTRTLWAPEDNKNLREATFVTDSVRIKPRYILERITLDDTQKEKLFSLLEKDYCSGISSTSACYEPRQLIVFYDNKNVPVGHYEICFECGNTNESDNLKKLPQFCIEKSEPMIDLFKEFGMKYVDGQNNKILGATEEKLLQEQENYLENKH